MALTVFLLSRIVDPQTGEIYRQVGPAVDRLIPETSRTLLSDLRFMVPAAFAVASASLGFIAAIIYRNLAEVLAGHVTKTTERLRG